MPQSYTQLHYHIVFSTRSRLPTIKPDRQAPLWAYIAGVVKGLGGIPIQIGGTADHVHLLVTLWQQTALADMIREIKAASSRWMHDAFPDADDFWWQAGYGAFTVSHSALEILKRYIANQEEHHRTLSYPDEFRGLLRKHELEFDERYLWD